MSNPVINSGVSCLNQKSFTIYRMYDDFRRKHENTGIPQVDLWKINNEKPKKMRKNPE